MTTLLVWGDNARPGMPGAARNRVVTDVCDELGRTDEAFAGEPGRPTYEDYVADVLRYLSREGE